MTNKSKELSELLNIPPMYENQRVPSGAFITEESYNGSWVCASWRKEDYKRVDVNFETPENFVNLLQVINVNGFQIALRCLDKVGKSFVVNIGCSGGCGKTLEEALTQAVCNYLKDKINIGGKCNEEQLELIKLEAQKIEWVY